ncbi:MAG: chorismate mutase [Planctomycetota bacterium]
MSGTQDLAALRARMDALNARLITLLHERAALAREIGRCKRAAALPVHDSTRERAELSAASETRPDDGFTPEQLHRILGEVIAASRALVEAPET